MKAVSPKLPRRLKGFTIVESVMAMVVLAIAAAGIVSLQRSIFFGSSDNQNLLVGSQLLQECGEYILATRRVNGYDSTATSCSGITVGSYSAPSVSSSVQSAGSGGCPSSATACQVITITQGSLSSVVLLLVK